MPNVQEPHLHLEMALVLFQSLEEPVQCALEMSRLLKNNPRVRLRMGVHSGTVDQTKGRVAQMGFLSCRAQSRHLLLLVIVKMRDSSTWLGMTEGVNRA